MASVDIYQMTTKDTNHKVAPVTIFDAVVNPLNKKTLDQEFEDMVGAVDESVAVDDADATLVTTALRKTEQVLTLSEKKQARTNINAADADDLTQLSETVSENKTNTDAKLSELGSKVKLLASEYAWDANSLIYSEKNIEQNPFANNTYNSLKYVYIPDIKEKVYVSFFKFTTDSNGNVDLGRVRLNKVSDNSQIYINYSNTSIEKIQGGVFDGCYKCYLDGTKYIIIDNTKFKYVEVDSQLHYFIINSSNIEVAFLNERIEKIEKSSNYWNPTRSIEPNERYTIETALAKLDEIIGNVPAGFTLGFYNLESIYEEWQSKLTGNNTKENWVKVGVRQEQIDGMENVLDELSLKSSYTAWSENSLVYSTENIPTIPFCYNTYKSLLYVYAPDIYDEVYVSFFKFTKDNNGDVDLGRIRLSKTSDDTQVYINYSNTSIEKIIGGTYDGCYKCYLDGVKYIIVSGKAFNSVEVESKVHYFIVNKDIPNIYSKLGEDDEKFKRVYKRIDFEDVKKIWHEDSNVLYSLKNKQNVNITVERTVNVIKDYRFSNIKDAYIIFFQVTNTDGIPTKVRAKLVDYNGNQLFINYSNTKIELIDKGIYKGYYKCYLDNFNYIIIDGNLYSNLATYEFNDDGNKWFIVKHKSSVRVLAYNSTIGNSEDFDFVCDGYDDHEEITKAIEMIGNGGTLELSDGVFNVGPISYDGICSSLRREHCRGISIKGQGIGLTTLKMQPSGLLIDGKDLGGYYNKSSFSFIPDNQPTAFYDNVYRGLKGVVYDQDLCLSSYTLTITGTDKDGKTITSSQTKNSASVFARLWFNEAYKTIDSIEFTNVVFAKQPTGIFKFCLCYSNSETNIFRFHGLDNILVEDLTLDGNYENAELSFLSTDSIKNGISLSECNNVNINRVESSNFFHHGVIGVKCHTVVQTNCILNGNGHRATHYHDNSKDIIFENNRCKNNGRNHGRNQDSGTSGIFIVYSNDNCIIKNNIIEGDDYCAIDIQQERINEDSYGQCIISGNVCKSDYESSTGIQVYTNRNADQLEGSFKNLIISDNTIFAKDSGVKITNAAIKGLVVKGNIVDMGNSGYRAFAIEGIVADAVENISITANVVANANTVSILNVKNAAVVGNVFDATNVNMSGTNIVNENNVLRS